MLVLPGLELDLLPVHSLGLALERQTGVHAIGSDRRRDFDTWPGTLAWTPPGVDVFSESPGGGEYLVLRWREEEAADPRARREWRGDRQAAMLGAVLRRALISGADRLVLQELALRFKALSAAPPREGMVSRRRYAVVIDAIEERFGQPMGLDDMAALCGQTPLAFLRGFTASVGQTPHAYLTARRVAAARRLLSQTRLPLAMVAADCGFSHQSHLGTAFRAATGLTPGAYRRKRGDF
jgi:AraC-like DNA-binding protein